MCKVLQVSRSGYYEWTHRKPSKRSLETQLIKDEVRLIYSWSKKRYGSPKITEELKAKGIKVSRPRVARIMQSEGIKSIVNRKYRVRTTESNHSLPIAPNILNRKFEVEEPGKVWVSDITYVPTGQNWLYLTVIMDLYDRKIIGWSISNTMTTESTVVPAWKMAQKNRQGYGVLFHSDRGVQYASSLFRDHLKKVNAIQSMSRKGNCWDNAVAENFFKTLKSELVKEAKFQHYMGAQLELFEFIEIWYNRKRKHAYLGYKTPEEYGQMNYFKCA